MKIRSTCALLVTLTVISFTLVSTAPATELRRTQTSITKDLKSYLDRQVSKGKFSGAVLLAKGDKVLFQHAYGLANRAFDAPNRVDTKFNLGSMGKMFTGIAILQLAQQGKLSLNDTVLKLVPDYPDKEVGAKITVHQLLTHTAGMGNLFNEKFNESSRARFRTTRSFLPLATGEPLRFEPGSKYEYSNAGFIVLGLIIEEVSGQSYQDYVREHIFNVAGMTNTDNYNVDDDVPNLALGYTTMGDDMHPQPNGKLRTNIFMHVARGGAAGGGYSTVQDLLRFSRALQTHVLLNDEFTNLDMAGKVDTGFPGEKYAYGMFDAVVNGVRIVGHSGGFSGINSQLDMYTDGGYTVAVMSNSDTGAQPVIERLRVLLTGQELPVAIHLPKEALHALVGKYALGTSNRPPVELLADEDGLFIVSRGTPHHFLPISAMEFFDENIPNNRLKFAADEHGSITGVTLVGFGPQPVQATRLP